MKKIYFIVAFFSLLFLAVFSHYFFMIKNTDYTQAYLKKFHYYAYTNNFKESLPRFYTGKKPFREALLILHGYSAATEEFNHLYPALEKANIPYYAPELMGFGIGDMHLLYVVEPGDWIREAINAYDLLAVLADKVDVIGHSNGGAIAVILAEYRPINKLILSGPDIAVMESDKLYKTLLQAPIVGQMITYVIPVFVKPVRPNRITNTDTMEPKAAASTFHYPALTVNSLLALWNLQDELKINSMHVKELYLLYGKYDLSVDNKMIKNLLNKNKVSYKYIEYSRSGHNIIEDYDKDAVINDIVNIIKNKAQ